jgi:aspartokinase
VPIVVQKYGGSSVADVEKIQRVADKVAAAKAAGRDAVRALHRELLTEGEPVDDGRA